MVKASVRSLTSSSSFISKAAFLTASVSGSTVEGRDGDSGKSKLTRWRKHESFHQMVLGPMSIHMQKKKNDLYPTPYTKTNSEGSTGLHIRTKTTNS